MKLYVGNLAKQVTDAQLNDFATPYGAVVSANVAIERKTGGSKGFGFIVFSNEAEAQAAMIGLNGREVHGQILTVNEARSLKAPTPQH